MSLMVIRVDGVDQAKFWIPHASASASASANASARSSASAHASANASASAPVPPPVPEDREVFRTRKGLRFHYRKFCSHAERSLALSEARAMGLTPCLKCVR